MDAAGLRRLAGQVLRVVGIGRLALVDDAGPQQKAQIAISAGGPDGVAEVIDGVPRLGQYGFAYCPPDGSEAIILFVGGRRSSGVVIATGHKDSRPKGLQPGEAMLYNGLTEAFIKMSADGKIVSKGDWEHDGKITATGVIKSDVDVLSDTISGKHHKHPGVQAGAAQSGEPV